MLSQWMTVFTEVWLESSHLVYITSHILVTNGITIEYFWRLLIVKVVVFNFV